MTAIDKQWIEWSFGYELPLNVAHIECKGARITGGKDCIVSYFAKKPRTGVAVAHVRQYDFAVILDVNLVIKNSHCLLVEQHRAQIIEASDVSASKVRKYSYHDALVSHGTTG